MHAAWLVSLPLDSFHVVHCEGGSAWVKWCLYNTMAAVGPFLGAVAVAVGASLWRRRQQLDAAAAAPEVDASEVGPDATVSQRRRAALLFETHGYIVVRRFLSGSSLESLKRSVLELAGADSPRRAAIPTEQVFYDDPSDPTTLKQIQHLYDHDDYVKELFHGRCKALAELLLGAAAEGQNCQYFNKTPHRSKATPPHQDGAYFRIEPQEATTMWLSLDHADQANGAVVYAPGTQAEGLRPHRTSGVLGFSLECAEWGGEDDVRREVPMAAAPGDILVHHSLTMHRAGANTTSRARRAVGLIYYSVNAKFDRYEAESYRRGLIAEWKASGRMAADS